MAGTVGEVFHFNDGQLHIYTGSHTASGNPVAYVTDVAVSLARSQEAVPVADGTYLYHTIDRRADLNCQIGYLLGSTLQTLFDLETAVHMKITHSDNLGSAGMILYSGRLQSLGLQATQDNPVSQSLAGDAHVWSAF